MKTTALTLLAIALLALPACHKDQKAAQVQALEKAYKSGVFTKEEYDAKMQALLGTAPAPPATAPPVAAAPPAVPPPADPGASASAGGMAPAPPAVAPAPAAPVQQAPPPSPPPQAAQPAMPAPAIPRQRPVAQTPQAAPVAPPAQSYQPSQPAIPPAPSQPPPAAAPAPPPVAAADQEDREPAPMAGCRDAEARAGGPNGVQERFFPVPVEAVRKATIQAFDNLDFTIHIDKPGEMEASKKRHLSAVVGAGGERLILHFSAEKKGGQNGTKVTAETKKSITGKLAQKSWTTAVLAQISCNLRR